MRRGALYVMIPGVMWTPVLFADNWATQDSVGIHFVPLSQELFQYLH